MTNALSGMPSPFRATSFLQRLRQSFRLEGPRRDGGESCGTADARKKDHSKWSLPRYGTLRRSSSKRPPPTLLAARQRDTSPRGKPGSPQASDAKEAQVPGSATRPAARAGAGHRKQQVQFASVDGDCDTSLPGGFRKSRRTRTIHTWLGAMLDASEGGLDATIEPSSPLPSGKSSRSLRTPGDASARSMGLCSPPGSPTTDTVTSIITLLREYFFTNVDFDGSGHLSRQDLFDHIRELLEKDAGKVLTDDDLELLGEVERCRFSEMDLGLEGQQGLGVYEWVHFIMLRASAPSHVAAKHLNRDLRTALEDEPELLKRLHATFEAADSEGDGLLRRDVWQQAFEPLGVQAPEQADFDREEDSLAGALSYYEFVAHALGLKASVVELALYDLSKGVAQWVPASLLGGHSFDGVWHSGLRVFGKEFWFGGVILESEFTDVPFGAPTRILRLGTTLRTHEDLVEFLKEDVYVDYNPKSYDVLRRNCNHFSNELAQFLLHGKQLPEEVLLQPEWVKNALLVSIFHPALNRWLGGFGDALTGREGYDGDLRAPQAVSRIDDMTEEWRHRLQVGDLVMHRRRFIDRPRVARLLYISGPDESGRHVAEIKFLRPTAVERLEDLSIESPPWAWEIVRESDVPLRQFYPVLEDSEGGARILRAGMAIRDSRARQVLRRSREFPAQPACAKGHPLKYQEGPGHWWASLRACSICASSLQSSEPPLFCAQCSFALCRRCRDQASQLPSGGVFTDMLTPELAKALLQDESWLAFKSRSYFFRADHHSTGAVDKAKISRVDARVAAELGVKPLAESELLKELQRLAPKTKGKALQLNEASFQSFFAAALSRGLMLLASGKEWRPCIRKRCKPRNRTHSAIADEIEAHLPKAVDGC